MMDVKCAQNHYASKYRVDMIVKALRKVQAYCDGQLHACHECIFWDAEEAECKLRGAYPLAWDLDDDDDATTDTRGKGV